MFRNHIGDIELPYMTTVLPALSVDVNLLPGTPRKWSLMGLTNLADLPGRRRAGVLMMSYFPFADPDGLEVFDSLETEAYRELDR